jgi:hypothetical protein
MAENKTININIKQNADKAEQSFKSYNKELGNTKKQYDAVLKSGKPFDQQLEDINRIVKETPLNVRDMNKQIQAYQSIALSAGRETPVGRKALEEAAALRDRYVDIQNETKRLADDQRTLEGAMQGVATGVAVYGGIQSAMALSGVESEKLRETLVKLQAAQTLMNSINQVATAFEKESALMLTLKTAKTKALTVATGAYATVTGTTTGLLKVFRIALASTGIGLIVVAIGALIANFDKLTKVFKPVINGLKAVGDAIGLTNFAKDERMEQTKKQMEFDRQMAEQELKAHNARMDQYRAEQAEQDALISKEIELAEARGEDTTEMQRAQLEKRLQDLKDNFQKEEDAFQEAEGSYVQYIKKEEADLQAALLFLRQKGVTDFRYLSREQQDEYEKTFKTTRKSIDMLEFSLKNQQKQINYVLTTEREKFGKTTQAQIDQAAKDIEIFEAKTTASQKAEQKKKADNYKKYLQDRLNAQRKIEDIENSMMEDGIEKELEINKDKFARLLEDTKKNTKLTREERNRLIELYEEQGEQKAEEIRAKYRQKEIDAERKHQKNLQDLENSFLDEIAAIEEENYQKTLSDEERELRAVADKYFRLETMAEGNAEQLAIIQEARMNEENEIYLKYQNEQYEIAKATSEKKKALDQAEQEYKIGVVQNGLQAINDIAALFADGSEKQAKRAFQVQKAVGIAQATINTAQAITKVFAETTDFTPVQALRIANAVAIGAAGAAQIAAIAKTQFQGGGGDLPGVTDLPGGGETTTPQFNVVGDSGINQLAQLQQQPAQAFVVSGEVTSAQALDRNRVTNATL